MPPRSLQAMHLQQHGTPLVAGRQGPRCTDALCCLIFVLALAAMVPLALWGIEYGNTEVIERFATGRDYQKRLCGHDEGVKNFKKTYFTLPAGSPPVNGSDWKTLRASLKPVCTTTCPQGNGVAESLPAATREGGMCPPDAYPDLCTWYGGQTTPVALYCVDPDAFGIPVDWKSWLADLENSVAVLVAMPFVAIIAGFLFLGFVHRFGALCIWAGLLVAALVPAGLGVGLFLNAKSQEETGQGKVQALDNLDVATQREIAYGLWAVGALVMLLACCFTRTIRGVISVLKATSQFLEDVPSQMLQPLVVGLVQLALFAGWLVLFVRVGSIGAEEGDMAKCLKVGDIYCLKWNNNNEIYGLLFLIFMLYWVMNFLHALSHFGTSYAVGEWFFAPTNPLSGRKEIHETQHSCCDFRLTIRAFFQGLVWHPGSLAYGALVISLAQFARMLIWWAKKSEAENGNAATRILRRCVDCLADCFTRCIEFISEHAYAELALGGENFCASARKGAAMAVLRPGLFALVGRVACAVRLIGLMVVVAITTSFTGLVLFKLPPQGLQSAAAPVAVTVVASLVVGEVMMHPFSSAARAALHCFCRDEDHARAMGTGLPAHTPQPMLRLAEEHGEAHQGSGCCCCF